MNCFQFLTQFLIIPHYSWSNSIYLFEKLDNLIRFKALNLSVGVNDEGYLKLTSGQFHLYLAVAAAASARDQHVGETQLAQSLSNRFNKRACLVAK